MEAPDHLAHLRADSATLAATIQDDTVDLSVPGCPGWDLRALAGHLGWVHRWAATAVRTGAPPDPSTIDAAPTAPADLGEWVLAGGTALADELDRADPDAPTWHPFPAPQVIGVWRRRQAQETSVHRWDAGSALGDPGPIDEVLASDGVGEYFEVMLPRRFERDGTGPPERPEWLQVEVTDAAGSWWVRTVDRRLQVRTDDPGRPPGAALRGRGEDLLLALYARRDHRAVALEGDPSLAAAWLALGGN